MNNNDTSILPPEAVAETLARCEAATPGPWAVGAGAISSPDHAERLSGWLILQDADDGDIMGVFQKNTPDLDFIAAARTDLPALCASHAAQAERIAALEAGLDWITFDASDLYEKYQSGGVDVSDVWHYLGAVQKARALLSEATPTTDEKED